MKFHSCLLSIHSIPWQCVRPQPAQLKVTQRSGNKQPGIQEQPLAPHRRVCRTRDCWHITASHPGTAMDVPLWCPYAHKDAHTVLAAQGSSDPANCPPGSCCHQPGWAGSAPWGRKFALVPDRAGAGTAGHRCRSFPSCRVLGARAGLAPLQRQQMGALGLVGRSSRSPLGMHRSKGGLQQKPLSLLSDTPAQDTHSAQKQLDECPAFY